MASRDPGPQPASMSSRTRLVLLLAFAFTVMGDPVSSVAYAIEAALRALTETWRCSW